MRGNLMPGNTLWWPYVAKFVPLAGFVSRPTIPVRRTALRQSIMHRKGVGGGWRLYDCFPKVPSSGLIKIFMLLPRGSELV